MFRMSIDRMLFSSALVMSSLSFWGQPAAAAEPSTGVAVVELFTSQGCSSCPSAERVVGNIARAAERSHRPVFTLAFHVDYWNRLGWTDPFSRAECSARQQWYGQALGLDQIYTPQMVVNGRTQFVGSDEAAADRAIADALAMPAQLPVTIKAERVGDAVRVTCSTPGVATDSMMNVAVVEQGLVTEVKRGENAGRTLDQPSVVRWFTSKQAKSDMTVSIPALPAVKTANATIVVYLQKSSHDPAMLGAAAVAMP